MRKQSKLSKVSLPAPSQPRKRFFPNPSWQYVGQDKVTSDCGQLVWFWAHRKLAKLYFSSKQVLDQEAFELLVDWENYYAVMHLVPRLFQLWVCMQTMSIAATNRARARFTEGMSPLCPSCKVEEETCAHILKSTE